MSNDCTVYHARPNVSGTAGIDKLNLDTLAAMRPCELLLHGLHCSLYVSS